MCDPDLVQQHVQNERIRDTCASQRKDLALQQAALKHQCESLPVHEPARPHRELHSSSNDYPHERLICLNSTSRH